MFCFHIHDWICLCVINQWPANIVQQVFVPQTNNHIYKFGGRQLEPNTFRGGGAFHVIHTDYRKQILFGWFYNALRKHFGVFHLKKKQKEIRSDKNTMVSVEHWLKWLYYWIPTCLLSTTTSIKYKYCTTFRKISTMCCPLRRYDLY